MDESSKLILRTIGAGMIIYVFVRIILGINNLFNGALGDFFRMIPIWFPNTFQEKTLYAIMIFLPITFIVHYKVILSGLGTGTIIWVGIIIGVIAGMFGNIMLLFILALLAMFPFLIKKLCNFGFTGYLEEK